MTTDHTYNTKKFQGERGGFNKRKQWFLISTKVKLILRQAKLYLEIFDTTESKQSLFLCIVVVSKKLVGMWLFLNNYRAKCFGSNGVCLPKLCLPVAQSG